LRAEKCYTLFSESAAPIPRHVSPPSPACLVGCMKCQEICPENEGRLRVEKAPVGFDDEETRAFLGLPGASLAARASAEAKFLSLGLSEDRAVYVRNLSRIFGLIS
jgi:epoxyqueuosine reductase